MEERRSAGKHCEAISKMGKNRPGGGIKGTPEKLTTEFGAKKTSHLEKQEAIY